MRVVNTVERLVAALAITIVLNGALVTAFRHAESQARAGHAQVQVA